MVITLLEALGLFSRKAEISEVDYTSTVLFIKRTLVQNKTIELSDEEIMLHKQSVVDEVGYAGFRKQHLCSKDLYLTYCDIEGYIKEDKNLIFVLCYFCDDNKIVRIHDRTGTYYTYPSYYKLNHIDSVILQKNKKEFSTDEK